VAEVVVIITHHKTQLVQLEVQVVAEEVITAIKQTTVLNSQVLVQLLIQAAAVAAVWMANQVTKHQVSVVPVVQVS